MTKPNENLNEEIKTVIRGMPEEDVRKLIEFVYVLKEKRKKECIENEVHR